MENVEGSGDFHGVVSIIVEVVDDYKSDKKQYGRYELLREFFFVGIVGPEKKEQEYNYQYRYAVYLHDAL